jgi:hypothetical protein
MSSFVHPGSGSVQYSRQRKSLGFANAAAAISGKAHALAIRAKNSIGHRDDLRFIRFSNYYFRVHSLSPNKYASMMNQFLPKRIVWSDQFPRLKTPSFTQVCMGTFCQAEGTFLPIGMMRMLLPQSSQRTQRVGVIPLWPLWPIISYVGFGLSGERHLFSGMISTQ